MANSLLAIDRNRNNLFENQEIRLDQIKTFYAVRYSTREIGNPEESIEKIGNLLRIDPGAQLTLNGTGRLLSFFLDNHP